MESEKSKCQSESDTSESDSDSESEPEVFHNEKLVIISSNEKISMFTWSVYLSKNWDRLMKENTRLLVLAGVHGNMDGRLGKNEDKERDNFVKDSEGQIQFLMDKFEADVQRKNISFAVKDVGSHRNKDTLDANNFVSAVKEFQPTMILLAFCWSKKSELNDLLRSAGVYSSLILREELAEVTESRHVHLDADQKSLIQRIVEENPRGVFLLGTSGSGKTLMLAEALKIKISKLRRDGREVRVFVSAMNGGVCLLRDLQEKYLPDIASDEDISFLQLNELERELKVEEHYHQPQSVIENILLSLCAGHQSSPSLQTILVVDEVFAMSKEESTKVPGVADWSSLASKGGVDFIVALTSWASSKTLYQVVPPTNVGVVSKRLSTPHRNCAGIASFLKFYVHHLGNTYLSTELDQIAEHLPPGKLPVWIERSWEVKDADVFTFINQAYVAGTNKNVTVLHERSNASAMAEVWCTAHGWRYMEKNMIYGSEDQCIVLVDVVMAPEFISRGHNLLLIVTTRGKKW